MSNPQPATTTTATTTTAATTTGKVTPISGFPEYLPAERIVEQRFLDVIRETFELHGFSSIETRAIEPVAGSSARAATPTRRSTVSPGLLATTRMLPNGVCTST